MLPLVVCLLLFIDITRAVVYHLHQHSPCSIHFLRLDSSSSVLYQFNKNSCLRLPGTLVDAATSQPLFQLTPAKPRGAWTLTPKHRELSVEQALPIHLVAQPSNKVWSLYMYSGLYAPSTFGFRFMRLKNKWRRQHKLELVNITTGRVLAILTPGALWSRRIGKVEWVDASTSEDPDLPLHLLAAFLQFQRRSQDQSIVTTTLFVGG